MPSTPGFRARLLSLAAWILACSLTLLIGSPMLAGPGRTQAATAYDWLQFGGDPQHSGNDTQETLVSASNVATLSRAFQATLPAVADGAATYLSAVSTGSGTEDLLFVTTKAGDIVALDAQTGAQVWIRHNPAGTCRINNGSSACYTTSSPAIDPNRQFVYSYGLDGRVHKYQVGNGAEVTTGGWPELATRKAFDEKGSSALSIATAGGATYLYVTTSGYPGDNGDYQGHLVAINLSSGAQAVFNALCSDQAVHFVERPGTPDCAEVQSGIWARPGTIYDAATDRLYLGTGNGTYAPANHDWGDTILALHPDGTGAGGDPVDSYTPTDFQQLQNGDADLGSTAPAILAAPSTSNVRHLAVQGGKDGVLRLLNLDNLSGQGGPGHAGGEVGTMSVPQGGEILPQPATWTNPADGSSWVFVANANGLAGLQLVVNESGAPSLATRWQTGAGGTSPIVANGVLYDAGGGQLRALSPTSGGTLWQGSIGGVHWESPIVADGVVYVTDENSHLTAFALPATATATSTPASTAAPSSTSTPTATAASTGGATPTVTATAPPTATPTATAPPPIRRSIVPLVPNGAPLPTGSGNPAPGGR